MLNYRAHLISYRKGAPDLQGWGNDRQRVREIRGIGRQKPCSPRPSDVDMKATTIKIYLILVNYGVHKYAIQFHLGALS